MRDQEQLAGRQKLREDYEYGAGNYDARRGGIRRSRSERVWRGEERQGTEVIWHLVFLCVACRYGDGRI